MDSILAHESGSPDHNNLTIGSPEKRKFFAQITERAANLKAIVTNSDSSSSNSAGAAGARTGSDGSLTLILSVDRDRVGLDTVRELQSLSDGHVWIGWDEVIPDSENHGTKKTVTLHPNRVA